MENMKSPRDKQFYEYKDGSPMPVEDLIEALRVAISMMAREMPTKPISDVTKLVKAGYERKLEVLEKVKESYELAKAMSVKPKMKPVKKR